MTPNQLKDSLSSAKLDLMVKMSPLQMAAATGHSVSVPCSQDEADALYQRLNQHFYRWTGKDLRSYRPGEPHG